MPTPLAKPTRRRTMPMGVVLGLVYGLLILVSLTVVLGLTAASNYSNTFALLNDKAILLMRTLSDRIYIHLQPAEAAVREVAKIYGGGGFDLGDARAQQTLMAGMLAASQVIDAILILNPDLTGQGLYREDDGNLRPFKPGDDGDTSDLERLKLMRPDQGAYWGPLVIAGGDGFVNVAAPLVRDGAITGYIVAAVGAEELSQVVSRVGVEDGATAFILYGQQGVFAHSLGEALGLPGKIDALKHVVPLADSGDPVLARYADREVLAPFKRAAESGIEVSEVDLGDGHDVVMLTRPIVDFGPVPWVAGLYLPQEAISDEIRRLYGSIALGVGMIAAAIVVSLIFARRIARPIAGLAVEAGHVERFELEAVNELPRSRIEELDQASTAFNGMVTALRAFSLYVPRNLVKRLIRQGFEEATRLHQGHATVLFTDIVGFTTLSETMSTDDVAYLLNDHFSRLVACVEAEGGTIDKFIGDGMMAVWTVGDPAEDARSAILAGMRIARAVTEENRAAAAECRAVLRVRVGIHSGPVIVGNLGAADRVNYTIIGDTVNVASRLEALGKSVAPAEACVVLASAHTIELARARALAVSCVNVGATALRGRSGSVDVCRVLWEEEAAEAAVP